MKGPPTVLQQVKSAHERTALRRLREARASLARARTHLEAKARQLEEYRAWRPPRERGLYKAIENRQVKLADLEQLNAEIVKLREREHGLTEELGELEHSVDAAGQAEREARIAWQAAQREVEKVGELLADWRRRQRQQIERQAELDLEEFNRRGGAAARLERGPQ